MTDLQCTPLSALKVCRHPADTVLLCTEHPPSTLKVCLPTDSVLFCTEHPPSTLKLCHLPTDIVLLCTEHPLFALKVCLPTDSVLFCTENLPSALKVCRLPTDSVLLCTEHPPPYCILFSVLHIVYTGCVLLNALTGSQIKRAAFDRR